MALPGTPRNPVNTMLHEQHCTNAPGTSGIEFSRTSSDNELLACDTSYRVAFAVAIISRSHGNEPAEAALADSHT
jgi:hypothetical protein